MSSFEIKGINTEQFIPFFEYGLCKQKKYFNRLIRCYDKNLNIDLNQGLAVRCRLPL